MRELLGSLARNEKMAILISSHNLAELDNFCNKVCIIKNGEIIETSEISAIKKDIEHEKFIIEIENTKEINKIYKEAEIINDKVFKINIKRENVPDLVIDMVKNNIKIYEIKEDEKSLEDAFFERTGGNVIE